MFRSLDRLTEHSSPAEEPPNIPKTPDYFID